MPLKLEELDPVQVSRTITTQEAMVARVDLELAALRRVVESRLARKDELLTSLAQSKSLIAPIRRLPVEILGMIFVECTNDSEDARHYDLALVCGLWKDVLWSTPAAWSTVVFDFGNREQSMRKAATFIRRARTSCLAIEVEACGYADQSITRDCFAETILILSNSPLCSVDIHAKRPVPSSMVASFITHLLCNRDISRLTAFAINQQSNFSDSELETCRTQLGGLRALTVLVIPYRLIMSSTPFLHRLTRLHIAGDTAYTPFDLSHLRNCTNLQELSIHHRGEERGSLPAFFTLPQLLSLHFSSSSVRSLFRYLRTPVLRTLVLENGKRFGTGDLTTAFKELIGQPNGPPPLDQIELYGTGVSQKGLIWALERLPTLVKVDIHCSIKINGQFIAALTREATARRPWMLPNLKSIRISGCPDVSRSRMMELVKARVHDVPTVAPMTKRSNKKLNPPCPLESVVLGNLNMLL